MKFNKMTGLKMNSPTYMLIGIIIVCTLITLGYPHNSIELYTGNMNGYGNGTDNKNREGGWNGNENSGRGTDIKMNNLLQDFQKNFGYPVDNDYDINDNEDNNTVIKGSVAVAAVDLVVARYNEDLSFLNNEPFKGNRIICYNKGPTLVTCPDCIDVIQLANVGKCDHTYLYHIINNYDNLADVTVFLPGSCLHDAIKRYKTYHTLDYIKDSKTSVFIGTSKVSQSELYNFTLNSHLTGSLENQKVNSSAALKPCSIQPFGNWYKQNFGNTTLKMIDYTSIFAVAREHIIQHPKSYYEKLISYIDDDISPECGHYIERSWVTIFSPLPDSSLYDYYV